MDLLDLCEIIIEFFKANPCGADVRQGTIYPPTYSFRGGIHLIESGLCIAFIYDEYVVVLGGYIMQSNDIKLYLTDPDFFGKLIGHIRARQCTYDI